MFLLKGTQRDIAHKNCSECNSMKKIEDNSLKELLKKANKKTVADLFIEIDKLKKQQSDDFFKNLHIDYREDFYD